MFGGPAGDRRRALAGLALSLLAACGGSDGDQATTSSSATSTSTSTTTTGATAGDLPVEPGRAVVVAGGTRFDFVVFRCLVGDETGAPTRRLALSASTTEPFLDARVVLNVDILVSRVVDGEEHGITITRLDDEPDLAAADSGRPFGAGPAPDDWIEVDEEARSVRGVGFQLRATDGSAPALPPGTLASDCPRPS